jgi:hypothetical protein
MDHDRQAELQRRIDQLERGYRRWQRTGIIAISIAFALLTFITYGYAQRPVMAIGTSAEPVKDAGKNEAAKVAIDASGMRTTYTNFFRVTGNPEEAYLDIGLYTQMVTPTGPEPVKLTDRLVMNFFTAKKLQAVLQTIVKRHEEAFGEIQVDPEKRLKPKGRED